MNDQPRRRQCAKCPWKKSTDPRKIPNGYCAEKHRALESTIAEPGILTASNELAVMACHESPTGAEQPCVGWLVHQLGPGNNIALRLQARAGRVNTNIEVDGPQHESFEDTLPKPTRHRRKRITS